MGQRDRLGEILLSKGVLDQATLDLALARIEDLAQPRPRIGAFLASEGIASESQVAEALAGQLGLSFVELGRTPLDPSLASFVPRRIARRHTVVPIAVDAAGILTVAMADPANIIAVDDLRAVLGYRSFRPVVATRSGILDAIVKLYQLGGATEVLDLDASSGAFDRIGGDDDDPGLEIDSAPIVQLVHGMFADAVRAGATDIHVEPAQDHLKVRVRVDGVLRESARLPSWVKKPAISRIKVLVGMDISEQRRPQDGRGRIRIDTHQLDIRASTIPTIWGEKAVLRLLPKDEHSLAIEQLGMTDHELTISRRYLGMPQGLIIFTGPTGSGKTTSLYGALRSLSAAERNMITLEDPVEYEIEGVNQMQVDERIGLTFARGLRAVLRQDPDVIMVGEIRDGDTARIVMQASMTGHVVFSTLHTNDAASAVTRLIDIGVDPLMVASSLSLVVGQRLVRTICTNCKRPSDPSAWTLGLLGLTQADLENADFCVGAGCDECGQTGFKGRTGIFEVLPISRKMRELISGGASSAVLGVAAQAEGMRTLRRAAIEKALAGITTVDEVLRVTHFEGEDTKNCAACGREVEKQLNACPYCGESLDDKNCMRCGSRVEQDWDACAFCGNDLMMAGGHSTALPIAPPPFTREPSPSDGRLKILVVDHDVRHASLIKFMLEPKYDVLLAPSGEDAILQMSTVRPDLVILSIALPDFSCEDTLTQMANMPAAQGIPAMLLTEDGFESRQLRCLEIGVRDLLPKPIRGEELRAKVAGLIRRASTSP